MKSKILFIYYLVLLILFVGCSGEMAQIDAQAREYNNKAKSKKFPDVKIDSTKKDTWEVEIDSPQVSLAQVTIATTTSTPSAQPTVTTQTVSVPSMQTVPVLLPAPIKYPMGVNQTVYMVIHKKFPSLSIKTKQEITDRILLTGVPNTVDSVIQVYVETKLQSLEKQGFMLSVDVNSPIDVSPKFRYAVGNSNNDTVILIEKPKKNCACNRP